MEKTHNWGILAAGGIAHTFAEGLKFVENANLHAIGSRNKTKAKEFAKKHNVPKAYGTYDELAVDPDVDIIYVASPHAFHYRDAMLGLQNGKAVLCEKAFTINAKEAEHLIRTAREKKLFLMEALWTRYLPVVIKTKQLIADGLIGDVNLLNADFGFLPEYDPKGRLFNPELGGGALLDIGIYTLSMTIFFMGMPKSWQSSAVFGETGVDYQNAMLLNFDQPKTAVLHTTLLANTPSEIKITGNKGSLTLHGPICRPSGLTIRLDGKKEQYEPAEQIGNGYCYEAIEVQRCLDEGELESATMPLDESLRIMQIMDNIRSTWGLSYWNDDQKL